MVVAALEHANTATTAATRVSRLKQRIVAVLELDVVHGNYAIVRLA